LREELERGMSRSISRQADNQVRVNQDAALSAVVQGLLAALSTVSPLVAGLRSLFKIKSSISVEDLFQKQKSSAIEQSVASVADLKEKFKKFFNEKAGGKRIYVFIDDLDRCLPNVALDLLEAIRNFLPEANCTFIIAADEDMIAQGLRLRYKDMYTSSNPRRIEEYLTKKGDEFFEKIVQLRVRLPKPSAEQAHAYISAQFPQWMPVTDIIQTAIGDNPRRMKQYCNLLTFRYSVTQERKLHGSDKAM
jgi:hypothetical protein